MLMILTTDFDYDIKQTNHNEVKITKYKLNTNGLEVLEEIVAVKNDYRKHITGRILEEKGTIEEGKVLYAKIKPDTKNHWDVTRDVWYEVLYRNDCEIRFINNLKQSKMFLSCYFDFKVGA